MNEYSIREVLPGEVEVAATLVQRVFTQFVAPDYSAEGAGNFRSFTQPETIRQRMGVNSFLLGAFFLEQIGGVLEMRDHSHISLLFTDAEYQHRGVARELFTAALIRCKAYNAALSEVTVNSSPYAVEVYQKLGFLQRSEEQEKDGIRYIPMVLKL